MGTDLLDRLLAVTVALGEEMTRSPGPEGLTPARTHLIWAVGRTGPCPQRALATMLDVSPRNITGLVDALVASGHVSREADPADRRTAVVTLTEHGRATFVALQEGHQRLAAQLFSDLDASTRDALRAALDQVLAKLETMT